MRFWRRHQQLHAEFRAELRRIEQRVDDLERRVDVLWKKHNNPSPFYAPDPRYRQR